MTDPETLGAEEHARITTCPRCGGRLEAAAMTCGWCQRASTPEERLQAAPPPPVRADLGALAKNAGAIPPRWLLLPALAGHLLAVCWLHYFIAPPLAYAAARDQAVMADGGRDKLRKELPAEQVAAYHRAVPTARLRGLVSVALLAACALIAFFFPFTGTLLGLGLDAAWSLVALAAWPVALGLQLDLMLLGLIIELMAFGAITAYTLDRVRLYRQLRRKVLGGPGAADDIVNY